MNKVLILVEGQTEEQFVNRVLNIHLERFDKYSRPVLVKTKEVKRGTKHKGGITSYSKVKKQVKNLLQDSSAAVITTMIDYYKLPEDFPGKNNVPPGDCFSKVSFLEQEFKKDINNPKFIPHFQLHEFESLLFCSADGFKKAFPRHGKESQINQIINEFVTPEEIDEGDETSPAKRIIELFPQYRKTLHGILITLELGLDEIRSKCRHFNAWMSKLEA